MSLDKSVPVSLGSITILDLKETTSSGRKDVGTTSEFIGNITIQFPATADVVSVVSTDASDNSTGTGIQTVKIVGINNDKKYIEETISLTGTTPSLTTNDFLRVNYVLAKSVGANNFAVGAISFTIGGSLVGKIDIGQNETNSTYHVVPLDRQEQLDTVFVSSFNAKIVTIQVLYRPVGQSFFWELVPVTIKDDKIVLPLNALVESGIEFAVFAFTDNATTDVTASLIFSKLNQ